MTEDGKNQGNSIADAIEETGEPNDDATVQISGTELAAIRQSATNMDLTAEELRQINRRKSESTPDDEDDESDATRTFDRNQLDAMMARKEGHDAGDGAAGDGFSDDAGDPAKVRAAVEEARDRADRADLAEQTPPPEEVDETGLDDWSEADMRAIVFGDTPAGGQPVEQPPTPASEPAQRPVPGEIDREADEFDELSEGELDELSDADLEELSDAEFDDLARELSSPALEEADQPPTDAPAADEPPVDELLADQESVAQPPMPDQPAPADLYDEDEQALASFRGAESRVLLFGGILASLTMLVVGSMRLWGDGHFTAVHPVVAGMFVAVGFLSLGGALITVLQGRS